MWYSCHKSRFNYNSSKLLRLLFDWRHRQKLQLLHHSLWVLHVSLPLTHQQSYERITRANSKHLLRQTLSQNKDSHRYFWKIKAQIPKNYWVPLPLSKHHLSQQTTLKWKKPRISWTPNMTTSIILWESGTTSGPAYNVNLGRKFKN